MKYHNDDLLPGERIYEVTVKQLKGYEHDSNSRVASADVLIVRVEDVNMPELMGVLFPPPVVAATVHHMKVN